MLETGKPEQDRRDSERLAKRIQRDRYPSHDPRETARQRRREAKADAEPGTAAFILMLALVTTVAAILGGPATALLVALLYILARMI